jgi:hypothetical protein
MARERERERERERDRRGEVDTGQRVREAREEGEEREIGVK